MRDENWADNAEGSEALTHVRRMGAWPTLKTQPSTQTMTRAVDCRNAAQFRQGCEWPIQPVAMGCERSVHEDDVRTCANSDSVEGTIRSEFDRSRLFGVVLVRPSRRSGFGDRSGCNAG